jgi:hypothetical protein
MPAWIICATDSSLTGAPPAVQPAKLSRSHQSRNSWVRRIPAGSEPGSSKVQQQTRNLEMVHATIRGWFSKNDAP